MDETGIYYVIEISQIQKDKYMFSLFFVVANIREQKKLNSIWAKLTSYDLLIVYNPGLYAWGTVVCIIFTCRTLYLEEQ